ncbi:MAG: TetR/AcrR family transcriptional regulator [Clostridiales bacterium]|nr:TetR/AcrR family transcriptional regulator [Clostridiales bacterium]
MRKGDIRKAAIIQTAEQLFYSKGYENTSIQDVLDVLKLSKGGFYHHFESKLSLLDAISLRRVEVNAENCLKAISKVEMHAIDKLNCVFSFCSFLNDESTEYISIMLRVAYIEGNVMLRDHIKLSGVSLLSEIVNDAIQEGIEKKLFYTKYSDELGRIILNHAYCLTDDAAQLLVSSQDVVETATKLREKIDAYNYVLETMLNAPHGSLCMLGDKVFSAVNFAVNDSLQAS